MSPCCSLNAYKSLITGFKPANCHLLLQGLFFQSLFEQKLFVFLTHLIITGTWLAQRFWREILAHDWL